MFSLMGLLVPRTRRCYDGRVSLSELFDDRHRLPTLSLMTLGGAAVGALVVFWFLLSHLVVLGLLGGTIAALIWLGSVWFKQNAG
jgi:hypothetical protein